ncbi:Aste57867_24892 [Aphanomyces stellatus]|uniref:Aste57867_24892 protein n=1 Tax=Aphanomyces stellatus TaxID=120398 RepID=A0A485LSK8_9STRA|nr:hypothetical protein As57867_024814 [Aphanomyces stellatus]VFU01526.1 Aste57867_24892 [Aphanomyces stellatus]
MASVAARVSTFFKRLSSRTYTATKESKSQSPEVATSDENDACEPPLIGVKLSSRVDDDDTSDTPMEACPSPATLTFERGRTDPLHRRDPFLTVVGPVKLAELEILGVLGVGTYGVVKLARHIPSGRAVALKVISKEYVVSMRQEKHIVRERFVHLRLRHPFVTTLYQTLQDDDCLYLVLEYLPGGELFTVVHSDTKSPLKKPDGGIPIPAALFYAACIVLALDYLHAQGTIYRDLKLENLVLDSQGYPKVLDFGFAKPDAVSERNGTMCGSLDYMAPEIVLREFHDHRADVWSFGILLYEMCLGTTPFNRENTREQMRCIQEEPVAFPNAFEDEFPDVCDLISRCLEKSPAKRYGDMASIKAHPAFASMPWESILAKKYKVPFVPDLHGAFDTSRFEFAPEDPAAYVEPYYDDGDDWAKDF